MSFMKPEIVHGLWLRVDTQNGTWWVPEDLVGPVFLKQDVVETLKIKISRNLSY